MKDPIQFYNSKIAVLKKWKCYGFFQIEFTSIFSNSIMVSRPCNNEQQ